MSTGADCELSIEKKPDDKMKPKKERFSNEEDMSDLDGLGGKSMHREDELSVGRIQAWSFQAQQIRCISVVIKEDAREERLWQRAGA